MAEAIRKERPTAVDGLRGKVPRITVENAPPGQRVVDVMAEFIEQDTDGEGRIGIAWPDGATPSGRARDA